jgi:lipoate-protein ligase A
MPLTVHAELANIRDTNRFILDRIAAALRRWEPAAAYRGISDLAVGDRKISGNAQRRRRRALLFHGTILHGMPADCIARYIKDPARQPDYRCDRTHHAFLGTIRAAPDDIKRAIADAWAVESPLDRWPETRMAAGIEAIRRRTQGEPLLNAVL